MNKAKSFEIPIRSKTSNAPEIKTLSEVIRFIQMSWAWIKLRKNDVLDFKNHEKASLALQRS